MLSTTTRPIFCFCCGKPLYYFEDLRHVPEFVIELRDPKKAIELNQQIVKYFIHQECWNTLLTYSDQIWKLNNDIKNINTE
jgi:hypothetical protein